MSLFVRFVGNVLTIHETATVCLCRILAENVLHEGLKVKLDQLIVGQNTRQLSIVGVNKIKDMIKTVGWVPHKGIMYAMPLEEHAVRCEEAFVKYDFSKLVGKVSCKVL